MFPIRPLVSLFVLALVAGPAFSQAVTPDDQLVRLDTYLEKIRKEYEFNRILGGGSLVGIGGLIGVGGTIVSQSLSTGFSDSASQSAMRNTGTALSWIYGGIFIVPGALTLILKPDYETMPERYAAAPSGTDDQKRQKVAIGEVSLRGLADKAKFERYLSAGLLGLAGGVTLASRFTSTGGGNGYGASATTFDATVYTAVFYLGAAVLKAVLPSTPENENDAYLRWKQAAVN